MEKTNESLPGVALLEFDAVRVKAIVEDIAKHYNVPVVFLALECPGGLKLKARHGVDVEEVPDDSIAKHGISRDLPIIIEDTMHKPRFAKDALVNGPPPRRFFVGAPLMLKHNRCVGSVCIMDTEPRSFTLMDAEFLNRSAKTVCSIYTSAADTKDFWTLTVSSLDQFQAKSDLNSDELRQLAATRNTMTLESLCEDTSPTLEMPASNADDPRRAGAAQKTMTLESLGEALVEENTIPPNQQPPP